MLESSTRPPTSIASLRVRPRRPRAGDAATASHQPTRVLAAARETVVVVQAAPVPVPVPVELGMVMAARPWALVSITLKARKEAQLKPRAKTTTPRTTDLRIGTLRWQQLWLLRWATRRQPSA